MKLIKITTFLLILYLSSCSSREWKLSDRMEGHSRGYFRVYVRADYLEDRDDDAYMTKIENDLLQKAEARCITLLKSYIENKYKDKNVFDNRIRMIPAILNKPTVRFMECYEKYCEAFIDFEAKDL